jgi:hypothetical protein
LKFDADGLELLQHGGMDFTDLSLMRVPVLEKVIGYRRDLNVPRPRILLGQ